MNRLPATAVSVIDDGRDEPNETFRVELRNPTGCFLTGNLDDPATVIAAAVVVAGGAAALLIRRRLFG